MQTRTHEKAVDRPLRYWIEVVEVDDDQGRTKRRRNRRLPNLHVGVTTVEPGPKLDARWKRKMHKSPGHWIGVRHDLMDPIEFSDRAAADEHKRLMVSRLSAAGFTVNGDLTVYSVYVIELDHSHLTDCPGYFYVGQTSKTPSRRVVEHRDGTRVGSRRLYSKEAHRYFKRWRPDLGKPTRHYSREAALEAEAQWRLFLEQRGYRVVGGQEMYDEMSRRDQENT